MKRPRRRHDIRGSICQVWDDAILLAERFDYTQIRERGNRKDLWDNYGFCTVPQPDQPISR